MAYRFSQSRDTPARSYIDELPEEILYKKMPLVMLSSAIVAIMSLLTIGAVKLWWPHLLPLPISLGWDIRGTFMDWCRSSWIMLVWGAGVTAWVKFSTNNHWRYNREAEEHFAKGALISIWAGVSEELIYRWLNFLGAVVWVQIFNVCTFGLVRWLHLNVLGPTADLASFHQLHTMMFHPLGWFIGAGMLASNASFRNGHAYQGLLGMANSWFIGMFMFWLVFRYGLPAAIVVHALYDLLIYVVKYIDAVHERSKGNC